jgi:hypothetical protein
MNLLVNSIAIVSLVGLGVILWLQRKVTYLESDMARDLEQAEFSAGKKGIYSQHISDPVVGIQGVPYNNHIFFAYIKTISQLMSSFKIDSLRAYKWLHRFLYLSVCGSFVVLALSFAGNRAMYFQVMVFFACYVVILHNSLIYWSALPTSTILNILILILELLLFHYQGYFTTTTMAVALGGMLSLLGTSAVLVRHQGFVLWLFPMIQLIYCFKWISLSAFIAGSIFWWLLYEKIYVDKNYPLYNFRTWFYRMLFTKTTGIFFSVEEKTAANRGFFHGRIQSILKNLFNGFYVGFWPGHPESIYRQIGISYYLFWLALFIDIFNGTLPRHLYFSVYVLLLFLGMGIHRTTPNCKATGYHFHCRYTLPLLFISHLYLLAVLPYLGVVPRLIALALMLLAAVQGTLKTLLVCLCGHRFINSGWKHEFNEPPHYQAAVNYFSQRQDPAMLFTVAGPCPYFSWRLNLPSAHAPDSYTDFSALVEYGEMLGCDHLIIPEFVSIMENSAFCQLDTSEQMRGHLRDKYQLRYIAYGPETNFLILQKK